MIMRNPYVFSLYSAYTGLNVMKREKREYKPNTMSKSLDILEDS